MGIHGTFVTALNCIDGRTQEPVIRYLTERYKVDYVDMITAPGMDGAFAKGQQPLVDNVRRAAVVSIEKHHSCAIAVVGHAECAGNPVSEGQHAADIRKGVTIVRSWKLPLEVVGLWVNERWEVEQLVL